MVDEAVKESLMMAEQNKSKNASEIPKEQILMQINKEFETEHKPTGGSKDLFGGLNSNDLFSKLEQH